MNGICDGSLFCTWIITTDPEPIFRWARTPPRSDRFSPAAAERSWRFHRSAGSIIGTSGLRPEHCWVPLEGSRVALKMPSGSPWTRQHFLPHPEPCRWQADKSNRHCRKTPCLLRGEKHLAGCGEKSIGGPDEIKRRDRFSMDRSFSKPDQGFILRSRLPTEPRSPAIGTIPVDPSDDAGDGGGNS